MESQLRLGCFMIEETAVECPYCGSSNGVEVDVRTESQDFVTDCEVCCRPMQVRIEIKDGEILSLDVSAN